MGKHLQLIVVPCLLFMGCADSEGPLAPRSPLVTEAAVIENVRNVPIEGVFFNECCDEEVHLSGTAHFVVTNNVVHVVVKDLAGIGLSSNLPYFGRGASVETNVFYSNPNGGTFTFGLNLANEEGCGFKVKVVNHLTTNAQGVVTTVIERYETQCQ